MVGQQDGALQQDGTLLTTGRSLALVGACVLCTETAMYMYVDVIRCTCDYVCASDPQQSNYCFLIHGFAPELHTSSRSRITPLTILSHLNCTVRTEP